MSGVRLVGMILGVVITLAGLAAGIFSMITYGFESPLTLLFMALFVIGLIITGLVWSQ